MPKARRVRRRVPAGDALDSVGSVREPPQLTPAQERTLTALRRDAEPLVFGATFVDELRTEAVAAIGELAERLDGRSMYVTKHLLGAVHECEVHFLHPDEFTWTAARARGQVSHRAIQLGVHWRGEPSPVDLVDEALARLEDEERDFGRWLAAAGEADRADVRGQAVDRVTKFVESFPPLDPRWHPMTEAAAQWPVDGPILLRARSDLVLGRPAGRESRKLIVDLKTGQFVDRHRHDLRFYALVETLVRDVPPRKLATFYLDSARPMTEDVTEATMHAALRRTLAGIERAIELQIEEATPVKRPGPACRWCPVQDGCGEGRAYLAGDRAD
jgi:PD-(D/E)XK nuclease superfamily